MTHYQELQNPALVRALAHPLRTRMLSILREREASPKELAAEFDIPLANVAYHIQVLRKLKLIRLVKKTPRRGAVEHHYRADRIAQIDNDAWNATPTVVKQTMVAAAVEEAGRDVMDAVATGGFEHADAFLTRSKLVLDQRGWDELSTMLNAVLDRGDELHEECAKRLRDAGHEGERRAGMVLMLYESMPSVPERDVSQNAHPSRTGSRAPARSRARASRVSA